MVVHTELGHVEVNYGGTSYPLIPSLSNIARIGTPEEIVKCFMDVESPVDFEWLKLGEQEIPVGYDIARGYACASWVLECCGLTSKLVGWTRTAIVDGKVKSCIVKGKIPPHDIFVLAAHCLKHGVLGVAESVTDEVTEEQKSVIREFNPYQYMYMATELFKCSLEEAGAMTMTQMLYLCKGKMYAEREAKGKPKSHKEGLAIQREMFKWAKATKDTVKTGKRIR